MEALRRTPRPRYSGWSRSDSEANVGGPPPAAAATVVRSRCICVAASLPTFASASDRDQPEYLGRGVRLSASMTAAQLRAFSAALRASTHFLRVEHFSA